MKTVYLSKNAKKIYDKFVLFEGAEVKSLKLAINYVVKNWSSKLGLNDEHDAEDYLRTTFREKCAAFHNNKEGKFFLGAVKLLKYGLRDDKDFKTIGHLVKILASDERLYTKNDMYLSNFPTFEDALRYVKNFEEGNKENDSEVFKDIREYFGNEYEVVPIKNFKQAEKYNEFTDWCICQSKMHFGGYTNNGEYHLYFVLRNGYQNEGSQSDYYDKKFADMYNDTDDEIDDYRYLFERKYCRWDDKYATSMLAVFVDNNQKLVMCVGRYNHDVEEFIPNMINGYPYRDFENYFSKKELSYILGKNFDELFPYNQPVVITRGMRRNIDDICRNCEEYLGNETHKVVENEEYVIELSRIGDYIVCNCDNNKDDNYSFIISYSERGYGRGVSDEHIFDKEIKVFGNCVVIPKFVGEGCIESTILDENLNVIYDNITCGENLTLKGDDYVYYMIVVTKDEAYNKNILNTDTKKMEFKDNVYNVSFVPTLSKDSGAIFGIKKDVNSGNDLYFASRHKFEEYGKSGNYKCLSGGYLIDIENNIISLKTGKSIGYKIATVNEIHGKGGGGNLAQADGYIFTKDKNGGIGICNDKCEVIFPNGEGNTFEFQKTYPSFQSAAVVMKTPEKYVMLFINKNGDCRTLVSSNKRIVRFGGYICAAYDDNKGGWVFYRFNRWANKVEKICDASDNIMVFSRFRETDEEKLFAKTIDGKIYEFEDYSNGNYKEVSPDEVSI